MPAEKRSISADSRLFAAVDKKIEQLAERGKFITFSKYIQQLIEDDVTASSLQNKAPPLTAAQKQLARLAQKLRNEQQRGVQKQ